MERGGGTVALTTRCPAAFILRVLRVFFLQCVLLVAGAAGTLRVREVGNVKLLLFGSSICKINLAVGLEIIFNEEFLIV